MNSEQEAFKILKNKEKAHIQVIAKQMRISNEYARLMCAGLARKGLIKQLQDRDWYEIKIKKKVKKEAKKKIHKKPKHNPGKDNPGEKIEEISLGLIIDKMINKIKVGLKNKIKLKIAKIRTLLRKNLFTR